VIRNNNNNNNNKVKQCHRHLYFNHLNTLVNIRTTYCDITKNCTTLHSACLLCAVLKISIDYFPEQHKSILFVVEVCRSLWGRNVTYIQLYNVDERQFSIGSLNIKNNYFLRAHNFSSLNLAEKHAFQNTDFEVVFIQGADKSLARPTSRCISFDGENISFEASLVIYINSTNIPPIMIIDRIYENQNLLSL